MDDTASGWATWEMIKQRISYTVTLAKLRGKEFSATPQKQ